LLNTSALPREKIGSTVLVLSKNGLIIQFVKFPSFRKQISRLEKLVCFIKKITKTICLFQRKKLLNYFRFFGSQNHLFVSEEKPFCFCKKKSCLFVLDEKVFQPFRFILLKKLLTNIFVLFQRKKVELFWFDEESC
jgi:hypothetical protein